MGLNITNLQSTLEDHFRHPVEQPIDGARRMAAAYATYAAGATSCSFGHPITVDPNREILVYALAAVLSAPPSPNPMDALQQMGVALAAFWLTPPVLFTGPSPGVIVVPPIPTLFVARMAAYLFPAMARAANREDIALPEPASAMAAAMDLMTRAIVVFHPPPTNPPTGCTGPIS